METKIWFTQINLVFNLTSFANTFLFINGTLILMRALTHLEVDFDFDFDMRFWFFYFDERAHTPWGCERFIRLCFGARVSSFIAFNARFRRLETEFLNTRSFHTSQSSSTQTEELWSRPILTLMPKIICQGFPQMGQNWYLSALVIFHHYVDQLALLCLLSVSWER